MLIFYPPKQIYEQDVTFMELICASPCFTSMTCFSLEKKRLADRALDQDAFMPRNRLVARGNATTFPLPWEDLAAKLHAAASMAHEGNLMLPKVGPQLAETVNVIIKAGAWDTDAADAATIIHQARVRRAMVMNLLRDAKERGHPAYVTLSLTDAAARADSLPEDGVPAEIVALLPHDKDLENVQRQKAATPVRELLPVEEVQRELATMCKPNAVVNERTSDGFGDDNAQQVAALYALAQPQPQSGETLVVHTGNRLLDQFEPWYFAFAFPFLFPYGTGMPDPPAWSVKARYRRQETAPHLELSAWMRCLSRRCEAQVNRDWIFGFALWNLFFRSKINLAPRTQLYEAQIYDEQRQTFRMLHSHDIEDGALQLLQNLNGNYRDTRGNVRAVRGDITKLAYVPGLRAGARKLLETMKQISANLPGTQEARKQMRHEIKAMRIRYGVPLFVTVSPDEAHQWLFIRMSRTRQSDPVRSASPWQEWSCGDRDFPSSDSACSFPIHVERLQRAFPTWHQRRTILARDPLASVDGFRTLFQLLLRYLFGVHFCSACPDCDRRATPCMDTAGSNATLLGGVFGRMDAVYVTIEAQKSSGSLHGHMQCFVQCLHQHTPLTEIFNLPAERLDTLREDYCQYNAHVAHSVYSGQTESEIDAGIRNAEASWPEHLLNDTMTRTPSYQTRRGPKPSTTDTAEQLPKTNSASKLEAEHWTAEYLQNDVVTLQYLKQHHYHPLNVETGERVPLKGCQKQEQKGVCKSEFPRDQWLCPRAKVLCPCEMERHGFPQRGRKNRLGSLHGPYGHPYLNPCHPAVLAAMRGGNNDVQVPYRLPFACETCGTTPSMAEKRAIALAAQRAQDAQTGYCSDYCAKNQPMGFHEIKEFQKGHVALHATLVHEDLNVIGKRHASRVLSDAYCKGLVRGQVECCNLRANHVEGQIVAAERFSTAGFVMFPGHVYVRLLELLTGDPDEGPQRRHYVTTTGPKAGSSKHLRESMTGQAYGHRPGNSETWWLSPYEFTMHWEIIPTRVPHTVREWEGTVPEDWDVKLTETGKQKLDASDRDAPLRLKPGSHYTIQLLQTDDRIFFPQKAATATLRHNWYLQRRRRPRCPHFGRAPVPQGFAADVDRNAKLTSVYFRAWTLDRTEATFSVPYLGNLLGPHTVWEDSLRAWLQRLPCADTKKYVGNFLSVYRVRPAGDADSNSDDDNVDSRFQLSHDKLATALRTQMPGNKKAATKAWNDDRTTEAEAAFARADQFWPWAQVPAVAQDDTNAFALIDPLPIQKAARKKPTATVPRHIDVPACVVAPDVPDHLTQVRTWKAMLSNSLITNKEQTQFCHQVADRIMQETHELNNGTEPAAIESEPMRWVLHGGPGTGKSYTLRLLREKLFEEILGWRHGIHFQIVSFQAVMAELLNGDTIHHALGLDWNGDSASNMLRGWDRARQTLQWRWLILDEFSMVSAELLAQLEMRCRELMRDVGVFKYRQHAGEPRPFGGLNVILAGDLYQLPPPKGTFLGDVPWDLVAGRKASKRATGHHGQRLLWGEAAAGIQGVTELIRSERTADAWLTEVQQQLRYGQLSDDNHAFLHGYPTSVPGSWLAQHAACENSVCSALASQNLAPADILTQECHLCRAERRTRQRVASENDPRVASFADAVSIFPTNDIKYHVNKLRALQ